jgi:hypothetical protein
MCEALGSICCMGGWWEGKQTIIIEKRQRVLIGDDHQYWKNERFKTMNVFCSHLPQLIQDMLSL